MHLGLKICMCVYKMSKYICIKKDMYHFLFSDISELFYETDRKYKNVLIYETQKYSGIKVVKNKRKVI